MSDPDQIPLPKIDAGTLIRANRKEMMDCLRESLARNWTIFQLR
jgi:hypothetical protein